MSAVIALIGTVLMSVPAVAADGPADFVAQGQAAGLSAGQARGLQNKVNGYLAKLGGQAHQVAPNRIESPGAVLNVTVPGETEPRALGASWIPECQGGANFGWFCAYEYGSFGGDNIGFYDCGQYKGIPWYTTGSWENNQTRGTQPYVYYGSGSGRLPGAYSVQRAGMNWGPVYGIVAC
ncbi:hypothetical protein CF165_38375 [Amycolatopsis vastitatis]|uniref:Peptidase inhibitor family I36 protein n=1 Tax=Amycolatopsis vastitatis TaxID=1905142 RepID=A0A229SRR1_9PSEU|nr:hypothetical protein CF165_38375 [Amycolatopsis vastitatis]